MPLQLKLGDKETFSVPDKIVVNENAIEGKTRVSQRLRFLVGNVSAVSKTLARFKLTMCAMTANWRGRSSRTIWSLSVAESSQIQIHKSTVYFARTATSSRNGSDVGDQDYHRILHFD